MKEKSTTCNQMELANSIKGNGEVNGRVLFAIALLSDVQDILNSNPHQAGIWLNQVKTILHGAAGDIHKIED